jgi:hypothetical protein
MIRTKGFPNRVIKKLFCALDKLQKYDSKI